MAGPLLVGAFGQRNPGDDALAEAFVRAIRDWEPAVTSRDPAATAAALDCEVVPATPRAVLRGLARADALVVGGGTVFKSLHPASGRRPIDLLARTAALTASARALRKPQAMVGVGAGALHGPGAKRLTREVARRADLLVLRDEESASSLAGAGARTPFRVGADPTWTLFEHTGNGGAREDCVVVVPSFLAGGPELPSTLAAALRPLVDDGIDVRLQPWQLRKDGVDDLDLARAVAARLPTGAEVLDPPADLHAARRDLAGCRAAVCLRFHAVVAAAAAGTPLVAYDHELKLGSLARRLGQTVVRPVEAPLELAGAVRRALDGRGPTRAAVSAEAAAAEEGFRLLRLLLTEGRSPEAADIAGLPLHPAA